MNMFSKMSEEVKNKVPDRPKRPTGAYNEFFRDSFVKLKAENPGLQVKDLAKTIGNQWKSLDPNVKQEMNEKYKKILEQYKEDIENWKNSLNNKQKETLLLELKVLIKSIAENFS